MIVKRIRPISCGKVLGVLYAMLGLIFGGVLTLLSLIGATAAMSDQGAAAILFGLGAVVIVPVFYGILGFVGGIITAALYNLAASVLGGIEIDVE